MQQGKWDAAFAVLGNPDLGFDFRGSPLGEDSFDYWSFLPTGLRYQDIFTGFVFFKPLAAQRMSVGIPAGSVDQAFADEILRRLALKGQDKGGPRSTCAEYKQQFETIRVFTYSEISETDQDKKIQQWLTNAAPSSPAQR
jgi:hypothetical protein